MLLLSKCRNAIIESSIMTGGHNPDGSQQNCIGYYLFIYIDGEQTYDYYCETIEMAKSCAAGFGITEWDDDYLMTDRYKKDPAIKIKVQFTQEYKNISIKGFVLNKGANHSLASIKIDDKFIDCTAILSSDLEIIYGQVYEIKYLLLQPHYDLPFIEKNVPIILYEKNHKANGSIIEIIVN